MKNLFFQLFLFSGLLAGNPTIAQKKMKINLSIAAQLPINGKLGKQPGLAGAFAGYIQNRLIIAGGANFPDSMPWQGGKKAYWDDIYVLNIGKKGKYSWEKTPVMKLKESIAYGASVQTNMGIVCVGGENENGISNKTFLLHSANSGNELEIIDLPALPVPLTNLSAVSIGNIVYAGGGETVSNVSDRFFKLDIEKKGDHWEELQSLPMQVSHAVMLAQTDGLSTHIFLLGGRKKNQSGISDFYSSVFEYDIKKNEWVKKMDMPYAVSAGVAISGGRNNILYIGGDKGEIFQKVETLQNAIKTEKDDLQKLQLIQQKNQLQINHPGFCKDVLEYDVVKDKWTLFDTLSADVPVTTTIVKTNKRYFIPSGEIKAGVRSHEVIVIESILW